MAYATIKRGSSGEGYFALSKENPPFFISPKQLAAWHLEEGAQLDEAQYLRIKALHAASACMEQAVKYLAMREHTAKELRQKLMQKQYAPDTIATTLATLQGSGAQSDERYAEILVRSRQSRNPEGKVMLLRRLAEKGVSSQLARRVVDEAFAGNGEMYVRTAWDMAWRQSPDRQKCLARMQRKGFSYGEVRRMLERRDD